MTNEELGSRRRRRILETGAALTTGLAGCPSEDKNSSSTPNESPTATDEPTPTETETPDGPSQEFLDDLLETNNQNMDRAYNTIPATQRYFRTRVDDIETQRKIAEKSGLEFNYSIHDKHPTGKVGVSFDDMILFSHIISTEEGHGPIGMQTYDLEDPKSVEEDLKNKYEITETDGDFWFAYSEEFDDYWTFDSENQTDYYTAEKKGIKHVRDTLEGDHPTVAEADDHPWPGSPPSQEHIVFGSQIDSNRFNSEFYDGQIQNILGGKRETGVDTLEFNENGFREAFYVFRSDSQDWKEYMTEDRGNPEDRENLTDLFTTF
jgi:hypothetical protein